MLWVHAPTWFVQATDDRKTPPRNLAKMTRYSTILPALLILGSLLPLRALQAAEAAVPSQVKMINEIIEQGWRDFEIRPASEADDSTWCRRVYLDVIGRVPDQAELSEFVSAKGKDKRAALVDTLLYDDKYTEEYASHWSTVWTNILIGQSGGNGRDSMISRAGMQKYLRDSFARNKPYNQIVFDLVTATGSTKPGTENFNGAVNFLVDKVNEEKGVLATSSTSRIFLGQQVQCTQCHNHPFNQWKQQMFWEFNSFFR